MEDKTRSFIAIDLPAEIRKAILRVQNRLKPGTKGIKWVSPENIHLTLRFLGNLDKREIEAVKEALADATGNGSPFYLSAKGIGAFPGMSRPRVIWIGLAGEIARLSELHLRLENQLEAIGIEREKRKFAGHLTIGRVKDRMDPVRFIDSVKTLKDFETEVFSVNQIILFKSELKPAGPMYTKLYSAELT